MATVYAGFGITFQLTTDLKLVPVWIMYPSSSAVQRRSAALQWAWSLSQAAEDTFEAKPL